MKICPACKSSYPQDYAVCPRDGTRLEEAGAWPEGTVVRGKYRVLRKVGEGGMGTVYKALHLRFDELRALKVIGAELASDSSFLKRFETEAVLTRRLQHPNAVRVEDIDEAEDGRPFIVMEYIEGQSLKKVIQDHGTLPLARVLAITRQVASALEAAHQIGMVHRDIKPENICLISAPQGEQAKVLDFGIAKIKEASSERMGGASMTETGVIIGSPPYMSPEQALGMRGSQLDGRSDLYSLGVVVYQMLTGELPLKADTTMAMLMAHIHDPPKPIREARPDLCIPDSIADLVMGLLEKKPEARPASAGAVKEIIERAERELAKPQAKTIIAKPADRLRDSARTPRESVGPQSPVPLERPPAAPPQPRPARAAPPEPAAEAATKPSRWRSWALGGFVVIVLAMFAFAVYARVRKREFEDVHRRGHEMMQRHDYDGAIREYRKALKLRPDLDHLRLDLALALEGKGQRRAAVEEFEVVCTRQPDLPECREDYMKLMKQLHMPPRP
jgi:eukaryotic-like serine/threonine-protein kinase